MSFRSAVAFLILLCSVSWAANEADESQARDRVSKIFETRHRQLKAETWKRTKSEREALIRDVLKFAHPAIDRSSLRERVMVLGDRQATREIVDEMVNDPVHRDQGVSASGSPYAVEFLAPHFFGTEPYSLTGGDTPRAPFSFAAALAAVRVMKDSSAFNGEVISWARRIEDGDRTELRAEMQRWWKENEAHFKTENWLAVQPGRDLKDPYADWRREKAEKRAREEAALPIALSGERPAPSPAVAETTAFKNSDSNVFLYVGAGILTLLVAAITIIARQARVRGSGN